MTRGGILNRASESLRDAAIDSHRLDAELIVAHVLECDRIKLITERDAEITAAESDLINKLIERRRDGEPSAYILGRREFYGLDFSVDSRVLIPRPETEMLVDLAISCAPEGGKFLDICTGSGAVAIAVKHTRPDLSVSASDVSPDALVVATSNATRLTGPESVRFMHSDVFDAFHGERFDIITANPPYISPSCDGALQKEISYEPHIALYSPDDGFSVIERIIAGFSAHILPGGRLFMEIGYDQGARVLSRAEAHSVHAEIAKDLSGHDRVAVLTPSF